MAGRHPLILHFADLQKLCAPEGPPPTPTTVARWADREGIRYRYDRKGRIWTTLDALNAALGIHAPAPDQAQRHLLEII
ncbi:hypothetical protein [Stenotrophomonas acidaminiphila]|uniref:hypothetical protein n=1 Tax=Stenotrophomonas acidaminiphila TaxID=128780 RepID=UPI0020C6CE9E|nr:hypothetical protein [Stenotrophomonas acidaminiphila]